MREVPCSRGLGHQCFVSHPSHLLSWCSVVQGRQKDCILPTVQARLSWNIGSHQWLEEPHQSGHPTAEGVAQTFLCGLIVTLYC